MTLAGLVGVQVFDTPGVKFVGEKNSDYLGNRVWDKDRGYEANKGNGHIDETLTLTTIDAKGGIKNPIQPRYRWCSISIS